MPHDRLHVVAGDVRDHSSVAATIAGADAVISMLGRERRGPAICSEGIRAVLSVMTESGPRRLVILSNYGVAESRRPTPYVVVSRLLERAVLDDKEQMEALVRSSDTTWTIIQAPILTDGPRSGRYRTGADLRLSFTSKVSRADLADLVPTEIEDCPHPRQAVAVTSNSRFPNPLRRRLLDDPTRAAE